MREPKPLARFRGKGITAGLEQRVAVLERDFHAIANTLAIFGTRIGALEDARGGPKTGSLSDAIHAELLARLGMK